jgi:hypothetical protein
MRIFKIVCVLFLVTNLLSILPALRGTRSPEPSGSVVDYQGRFGTVVRRQGPSPSRPIAITISLIWVATCAGALYGIHKRAPPTWKLGWGVRVAALIACDLGRLPTILKIPTSDYPWVAFAGWSVRCLAVGLF